MELYMSYTVIHSYTLCSINWIGILALFSGIFATSDLACSFFEENYIVTIMTTIRRPCRLSLSLQISSTIDILSMNTHNLNVYPHLNQFSYVGGPTPGPRFIASGPLSVKSLDIIDSILVLSFENTIPCSYDPLPVLSTNKSPFIVIYSIYNL